VTEGSAHLTTFAIVRQRIVKRTDMSIRRVVLESRIRICRMHLKVTVLQAIRVLLSESGDRRPTQICLGNMSYTGERDAAVLVRRTVNGEHLSYTRFRADNLATYRRYTCIR
jgi:hypothetical protein